MPQEGIWLWDDTNKVWVKAQCDTDGKLLISDADPFTIQQTTPQNLKHVPHGYYAASSAYLPLAVDVDGVLLTTEKVKNITITFVIDGGGLAITTGQKGHLEIPFACTLTGWTLMADVAGAIVIDVWKDNYANFPPTNADAMPGGGKEPTIAATNQKNQDIDISDWTTVAIAAGDILAFNVDSCTTITKVTLSLKATKS
jgi:hypothetical protein